MEKVQRNSVSVRVVLAAGLVSLGVLTGCDNAGQGAMTGAGVGALSGLAIGSLSGNAGQGALIGAVAGGAGGAVIGDQNRRANERADAANAARREQQPPTVIVQPAPTPVQPVAPVQTPSTPPAAAPAMATHDRDRLALAKFARPWRVEGWEMVDGQRRFVSGTATGQIDNRFFIRLDMAMTDQQSGQVNTGNVIFASEPGRGLTMNSRFDSSPTPVTYEGTVSADGQIFTLNELAPGFGPNGRRLIIRFLSPDNFVADSTDRAGGQATPRASLTFTAQR